MGRAGAGTPLRGMGSDKAALFGGQMGAMVADPGNPRFSSKRGLRERGDPKGPGGLGCGVPGFLEVDSARVPFL